MADLIVTPWTPGLGGGQRMRTYGIVRALAAHGPVDVLYPVLDETPPSPEYRAMANVMLHAVEPKRGPRRALSFGAALARGVPPVFARGASRELTAAIDELADTPNRGRVIVDGLVVAALTEQLARRRPLIYNAHNLESAFRREARAHGDPISGRLLERCERRALRHVAEAWMVSRKDMEGSLALAPHTPVKVVPNVVDVAAITPIAQPAGERRVLLVADYRWPPNLEGAIFLRDSVFPLVWERLPEARLMLVGRGLPEGFAGDDRVETVGFVTDLATAYAQADCVVVPLLTGGGSPLKFVEALAYGLPVVATSHAAAGLDIRPDHDFVQATTPQELSDALVNVVTEGAPEIAARGRILAETKYSIEALTRILAGEPVLEVAR